MTWYYERDIENNRIRLRFKSDDGTIYGPIDVDWPDAPASTQAADGWITHPDLKGVAGNATTDLYVDINPETSMMALRDLAAGIVEEGNPDTS